ncbi:RNA polymerase II-associated protein 3 [Daktulosphaira vitifoliae]|uniref:RNA polymerase II-associated protein 3 n=1 Tax=Daktulosphaira vitifoliae TaxID=58002 RepID=UPI0021A9AF68|nr:RNA polymerase II-associated protein 3 [Daktulosphaira vitifoliae]
MNNPYLLKQQLQENEDELSNYLRDMKIWQDKMKRKDSSPILEKDDKKLKFNQSCNSNTKNKISSWDYSAWEKFDVDKACEEIDHKNEKELPTNSNVDSISKTRNQKRHSEALYEKDLGNSLVQKQKWSEAILRYTRAIEYYDKDPVFYANRALCYLQMKEFKSVINDCCASIKLDKTYVKAYQRRSAAYLSLNMYNEAKADLLEVLKLEPNNSQAKQSFIIVNKKISKNTDLKVKPVNSKTHSSLLFDSSEKTISTMPQNWPSRVNCKQINPIFKPPHLRSKKPLLTPTIEAIQVERDVADVNILQNTFNEVFSVNSTVLNNNCTEPKANKNVTQPTSKLKLPPSPKTYIQLKQDWEYLKTDTNLLYQYLKQIPGRNLPEIVKNSMDNDLFVNIIQILKMEFIKNDHDVTDYLIGISELPRLQMLIMFCSADQLSSINELFIYASKSTSNDVLNKIKDLFGI